MNFPPRKPADPSPRRSFILLLFLTGLLLLPGCASKPWGDPLDEEESRRYAQLFTVMRGRQQSCPACLDGDVSLFLTSRIGKRAAKGYFQLMQPSHLRFVASNPFGQPLMLFTSDGENFHYINTTERLSLTGDVTQFFRSLGAPEGLVSTTWGEWLAGTLPETGAVEQARKDGDGRGVWFTLSSPDSPGKKEHLLLDTTAEKLHSRIISLQDKILLKIDYEWNKQDESTDVCSSQPDTIHITGLDYGTRVTMQISNKGEILGCSPADFNLLRPPGYLHKEVQRAEMGNH